MYNALSYKYSFRILIFASVFTLFLFCFTSFAFAQTSGLSLVTNPLTPEPNSTVTVSLDDYSLNTIGSDITWFVNNIQRTENRNNRSLQIVTGKPGEETIVRAVLTRTNLPSLSTSLTIRPAQVDIILEASTYTPHFYRGRALPSQNSMMRAIAVVNNGKNISEKTLVYKWEIDGSSLFGGPLKGKDVIDIQMPLFDESVLSVEVFTDTGLKVGSGDVLLKHATPEIHFYEYSPLRGLSERELGSPFRLISEETTLYGEPYFIDAPTSVTGATYTWRLNNEKVTENIDIPNALTLRHVGGGGESTINLRVVTEKTIPQLVTKAFQIIFE